MIYVRSKKDRAAYDELNRRIPDDKFVPVKLTPQMERLINVHEDVEVQPEPKQAAVAEAKKD